MTDSQNDKMARILAELGKLVFMPLFLKPGWDPFPRHAQSSVEALKLFLNGYAFEHAGRPPQFALNAVKALENLISDGNEDSLSSAGFSEKLWDKFCELMNGRGTFRKGNPLNPERSAHLVDAVTLCQDLIDDGQNLYLFASRAVENNRLRDAHGTLQRIRGIGPKIASLFLRDVAMVVNVREPLLADRELLQPIDVWLKRTTEALTGTSVKAARELVRLADEADCSALWLNAGSWYFASKIALTETKLAECLQSPDALKRSIAEHRNRVCEECKLLGTE